MTQCELCGKLIASGTAESLCRTCRAAARETAREVAREYLAPEPEAPPVETDAVDAEAPRCVRCRKHDAMPDSHFCVGCQLELVHALGDAAEELFRTPPPPPPPPVASPVSLMKDLEEKRMRTATSHMRVVGGVKIK